MANADNPKTAPSKDPKTAGVGRTAPAPAKPAITKK